MGLICSESVAVVKPGHMKHHYIALFIAINESLMVKY